MLTCQIGTVSRIVCVSKQTAGVVQLVSDILVHRPKNRENGPGLFQQVKCLLTL